jgi:hypothetical protein
MKANACWIALLMCIASQAQTPQPSSPRVAWPQEPTSFFGIALGRPIRMSIPECPTVTEFGLTRHESVGFGAPCFEPVSEFYEVDNVPNFFHVFVHEIGGNVEYISAQFNNGNAASLATLDAKGVADALIEKFGAPHYATTEVLRSNEGVPFENRILRWSGRNVEIEFDSVSGEYNHGLVSIYTGAYKAQQSQQQRQQKDSLRNIF